MNYRGSYRHLLRNSKAAMLAAIEIYNKPTFEYRDECFVILLLNAWELLLKALLSKNRQSIYYPKQRHEPYRTLSRRDALNKGEAFFPKSLPPLPIRKNLDLLGTYRDNSVHFYNAHGFSALVYSLAQTSIVNFKDLLKSEFDVDLGEEISWQLLPLGLKAPVDPIQYISQGGKSEKTASAAVRQFLTELALATREVERAGSDTGRLLTVFAVKLESIKKIGNADLVVGVEKSESISGPLAIVKTQDPNISHPLRQKDVVEKIGSLHDRSFTTYTFQAIVWKYELRDNPQYCWRAKEGFLTRYSQDIIAWIRSLSAVDFRNAISDYRHHCSERRKASKGP